MIETLPGDAGQIVPMTRTILNLAPKRQFAMTTMLVTTLTFAATANALCLLSYL